MALYAFDGTMNEINNDPGQDTNVRKFFLAFDEAYKSNINNPGRNFYVEGVGTRLSVIGKFFGGVFGVGGQDRIAEAKKALEENLEKGDCEINVIGFSRGSALALEFINDIEKAIARDEPLRAKSEKILLNKDDKVRFLGLWDTVGSFGMPGNNINLGYELTVPPIVTSCFHAIALDERRRTFPLTRMVQDRFSDTTKKVDIQEVWFRGYHSDVGGGNSNTGLSNITLHWMYNNAISCNLAIADSYITTAQQGCRNDVPCKKPGMDIKENKKRTIKPYDQVHDSVVWREFADDFPANNPPRGLKVVNDAGEHVGDFPGRPGAN